ncbi:MAG: hypothetical protein KA956_14205 [Pyrinomonadaceae bacterium]|nr:hypothetical protein [Acidobacteriota bacterium]MBK7932427.1 hypothetical protein [Acidobacteriota bacterium]MBP7377620.1 hypothetical protein [Pyrinomonadaceae bacterium]
MKSARIDRWSEGTSANSAALLRDLCVDQLRAEEFDEIDRFAGRDEFA